MNGVAYIKKPNEETVALMKNDLMEGIGIKFIGKGKEILMGDFWENGLIDGFKWETRGEENKFYIIKEGNMPQLLKI